MAITNARIKPAEYLRTVHLATPEAGTTLQDVLQPEYWAHVAKSFHISDRIEVIPEDHAYFAELYVIGTTANSVKVVSLRHYDFDTEELAAALKEEPEMYVAWRGPNSKFAVMRKKDKAILQDGFVTKLDAQRWMTSNNKAA